MVPGSMIKSNCLKIFFPTSGALSNQIFYGAKHHDFATVGAAINILRKVWAQIALLQEKTCVRKIDAALGRAYVCAV